MMPPGHAPSISAFTPIRTETEIVPLRLATQEVSAEGGSAGCGNQRMKSSFKKRLPKSSLSLVTTISRSGFPCREHSKKKQKTTFKSIVDDPEGDMEKVPVESRDCRSNALMAKNKRKKTLKPTPIRLQSIAALRVYHFVTLKDYGLSNSEDKSKMLGTQLLAGSSCSVSHSKLAMRCNSPKICHTEDEEDSESRFSEDELLTGSTGQSFPSTFSKDTNFEKIRTTRSHDKISKHLDTEEEEEELRRAFLEEEDDEAEDTIVPVEAEDEEVEHILAASKEEEVQDMLAALNQMEGLKDDQENMHAIRTLISQATKNPDGRGALLNIDDVVAFIVQKRSEAEFLSVAGASCPSSSRQTNDDPRTMEDARLMDQARLASEQARELEEKALQERRENEERVKLMKSTMDEWLYPPSEDDRRHMFPESWLLKHEPLMPLMKKMINLQSKGVARHETEVKQKLICLLKVEKRAKRYHFDAPKTYFTTVVAGRMLLAASKEVGDAPPVMTGEIDSIVQTLEEGMSWNVDKWTGGVPSIFQTGKPKCRDEMVDLTI